METVLKNEEFITNEHQYSRKEIIAAFLSMLLGLFITESVFFSDRTVYFSAAVCAILFLGFAVVFYKENVKLGNKYIIAQALVILLFSVNLIIGSNITIRNLNIFTLFLASDYFVYTLSSGKIKPGIYYLGEIFSSVYRIPFRYSACCIKAIKSIFSNIKIGMLKPVLTGLALSIPVMVFVVPLLISADENMENIFIEIINGAFIDNVNIGRSIARVVLTLITGSRIYAVIFGNSIHDADECENEESGPKKYFQPVVIVSMIFPLCMLYIVFFCSQLGYFVSAFMGTLPDEFSYAEYARRGFFELCGVASINLGVSAFINSVCEKPDGRSPLALKLCLIVMSLFTEVLIATALSKMIMYIVSYGFTPLRIYATIFMAAMAAFFAMMIVKQVCEEFDIRSGAVVTVLTALLLVSYGRVDARTAQFNILLYKSGVTEELDTNLLGRLSDEAVPYIHALAKSGGSYSEEAENILEKKYIRKHEFNFSSYRAEKILEKYR